MHAFFSNLANRQTDRQTRAKHLPPPLLEVNQLGNGMHEKVGLHSLASGYACQHILNLFPRLEVGKVVAGRASEVKIPWVARLGLL